MFEATPVKKIVKNIKYRYLETFGFWVRARNINQTFFPHVLKCQKKKKNSLKSKFLSEFFLTK